MLASLLYPYDIDVPYLIDGWVRELEQTECIHRYKIGDSTYLQVSNWQKHQKIDHPGKSKIPPFDESSRILANPREPSGEDQGSRIKEGIKEETLVQPQKDEVELTLFPPKKNGHDTEVKKAVESVFDYYLQKTGKDEKIYTLTPLRLKHGLTRYTELLKRTQGNPIRAGELMRLAVDAIAASDFHMGNNKQNTKYVDWIDHLFKSRETMEKWLERT